MMKARSLRRRSTGLSEKSNEDPLGATTTRMTPLQKAARYLTRQWQFVAFDRLPSDARIKREQELQTGGVSRLEEGQHFPAHKDLLLLPPAVKATLESAAFNVIRASLLPIYAKRLRLRARAVMATEIATKNNGSAGKPTASTLSALTSLFYRWQELAAVADAFVPVAYLHNEVIIHDREPHLTGLHIVGVGRVEAATGKTAPAGPGSIIGDDNLVTQQPHRKKIRCLSDECVIWILPYHVFAEYYAKQSPEVKKYVQDHAATQRLQNMRQAYAHLMTIDAMRRHREFATFEDPMITACLEKAACKVYREGTEIFCSDDAASSLFVLLSGSVRQETRGVAPELSASRKRRGTTVSNDSFGSNCPLIEVTLEPIAVFGGMSWIQNRRRESHAVAITTCDVLVIAREAIKADLALAPKATVPRLYPGDDDASSLRYFQHAQNIPFLFAAVEEAAEIREERLKEQAIRSRAALLAAAQGIRASPGPTSASSPSPVRRNKPSVSLSLDPRDAVKEIAATLKLHIHNANTSLFGTSEQCDRIIIPVSGKAKALTKANGAVPLALDEAVGYTLLVPHRWYCRAVVVTQMETLEISFDDYHAILDKYGLVGRVMAYINALMFPDAAKPHILAIARDIESRLVNPRLYPLLSLQQIALATAIDPLPGALANGGAVDPVTVVKAVTTGECRKPSQYQLAKLDPIPVRVGSQVAMFSNVSKSRIMTRAQFVSTKIESPTESPSTLNKGDSPTKSRPPIEPLVLGRQQRVLFGYGDQLPKSKLLLSGTNSSSPSPSGSLRGSSHHVRNRSPTL